MLYTNAFLKTKRLERYKSSNAAHYAIYEKLKQEGMTGLHYIKDNDFIGTDGEGTVDGTHFSDLGYMRFAEKLVGPMREIVHGVG